MALDISHPPVRGQIQVVKSNQQASGKCSIQGTRLTANVATAEGACCPRGGFELEDPKKEDPAAIELLLHFDHKCT